MLQSASSSAVQATLEGEHLTPRRLRHVTGIQIRNLTPFPVRDAFTSALTQPAEQSHFNTSGVTDDLGALLSRNRSRKISTASTATRRSLKWEDGIVEQDSTVVAETRARTLSSASRITFADSGNASTSPTNSGHTFSSPRPSHSLRGRRGRTSSMTSSNSIHLAASSLQLDSPSASITVPNLLPDNSQVALERVIGSRLVETFIAITVPPMPHRVEDHLTGISPPQPSSTRRTAPLRSAPASKTVFPPNPPPSRSSSGTQTHSRDPSTLTSPTKGRFPPDSAPPSKTSFKAMPQRQEGKARPSPPRVNGSKTSGKLLPKGKGKPGPALPVEVDELVEGIPNTPIYFSPIHRPSTNPFFSIDARSGRDFPPNYDIGGQKLKVEVWGRQSTPGRSTISEESRRKSIVAGIFDGWKVLEECNIDLERLIPLPEDLDINPNQLPSNTLVITLLPPGRSYYLPPAIKAHSRSPSPSAGYTSDPESEIRKAKKITDANGVHFAEIVPLSRRRRQKGTGGTADSKETAKTATWQEIFKLVTHQSCILDNQSSTNDVIQKIDKVLEEDQTFPLRRDATEREARIRELRADHGTVLDRIAQRREELVERSRRLQERAELLASAGDGIVFDSGANVKIESERAQLATLRQRTTSTQTSLLATLSTIFPIELYSPPDLLFTILNVPLPIPLTSNDPAPPLTLPDHKDVTDEAVATALGYVAQVVQILAAYLGKSLIYPVTCVGSRSLIRDGISAMVGPRMFPLFSKGVDTYRFEYGVFLLNKNVEMLMGERDLRALDMRHTLPNLKNLLLTLSHGAPVPPIPPRRISSPMSSASGLETPSRESSPNSDDAITPKTSHVLLAQIPADRTTPTASGANTPTVATDESRKGKPSFLGFPFTDFLRVRYPSTSQSSDKTMLGSNPVDGDASDSAESYSGGELDEEDRKTIHGVAPEGTSEASSVIGQDVVEA